MPQFARGWELILILLIGMLLFGSKKLPGAARSLGQSLRIFKAETKGLREDQRDGLDGKDDAAVKHGEITADQSEAATASQTLGQSAAEREEALLKREAALREREESLRRESEAR
jgi:sec-independent protein translocase protein TatA